MASLPRFSFATTRSILNGIGTVRQTAESLKALGRRSGQSVVVVTDPGIAQLGLELELLSNLKNNGFDPIMYSETVADPPEAQVLEAVQLARQCNASAIVGFGGGSSMDVAKLVAFLAHKDCDQSIQDIYGVDQCVGSRLTLAQIPTTAGTGSEVTPISIITTGESEKKGVVSQQLLPDIAILDGSLTTSLPPNVTAATGIDAMVHALEAYTSKVKKNPLSDLLAREALVLLSSNIHKAVFSGEDLNARSAMLLGSMYAGMAFANSPVAAVHALAYPIGAQFKVPHGLSNSLMLPNEPAAQALYDELTPVIFPSGAEDLASGFDVLATDLGLPRTLTEVGITSSDISMLAHDAMKQTRLLPNNMREVQLEDATAMYNAAL